MTIEHDAFTVEAAGEVCDLGWQNEKLIRVWRFEDAPEFLRQLSNNGGDEDWLAFVPCHFEDDLYIGWMESGGFDTCYKPQRYRLKAYGELMGYIFIGSHA